MNYAFRRVSYELCINVILSENYLKNNTKITAKVDKATIDVLVSPP
jgi:hypothetical protein